MKPILTWLVVVFGAAAAGVFVTHLLKNNHFGISDTALFVSPDLAQITTAPQPMDWQTLLPIEERGIHQRYAAGKTEDLSAQILDALSASQDSEWQAAQHSVNTNPSVDGTHVAIPGFMVPVDVTSSNHVESFFLVPYYGACLHYPPPPPNQIIYVRVKGKLAMTNLAQAYLVEGHLHIGLYEDPVGTSAYLLDLDRLTIFEGEPDDVRQHGS